MYNLRILKENTTKSSVFNPSQGYKPIFSVFVGRFWTTIDAHFPVQWHCQCAFEGHNKSWRAIIYERCNISLRTIYSSIYHLCFNCTLCFILGFNFNLIGWFLGSNQKLYLSSWYKFFGIKYAEIGFQEEYKFLWATNTKY